MKRTCDKCKRTFNSDMYGTDETLSKVYCKECSLGVSPQEDWEPRFEKLFFIENGSIPVEVYVELKDFIRPLLSHDQKRNADLKRKIEEMNAEMEYQGTEDEKVAYDVAIDDVLNLLKEK